MTIWACFSTITRLLFSKEELARSLGGVSSFSLLLGFSCYVMVVPTTRLKLALAELKQIRAGSVVLLIHLVF